MEGERDEDVEMPNSACENCRNRLDLHQPDTIVPGRLLGTCGVCHAWFTIDVAPDNSVSAAQLIRGRGPMV